MMRALPPSRAFTPPTSPNPCPPLWSGRDRTARPRTCRGSHLLSRGNYAKARRVQTAHVPTPHRLRCRRSELRPSLRKFPQSAAKLKRPREYAHSDPAAQSALRDPKSSPHLSWSQDSPPTSTKLDLHLNHSLSQGGVAQGHSLRCGHPGSVSTSGRVCSSRYRPASTSNSAARSRMSVRSRSQ